MNYSGIGSRSVPESKAHLMYEVAAYLGTRGLVLRSGGADGSDLAFEKGVISVNGEKEIYLPWKGFNGNKSPLYNVTPEAIQMASEYHPNWSACRDSVRKLHGRNVFQVLGPQLNDPVSFLICWTEGGEDIGGTRTAIKIARDHGVPVHNIFHWPEGFEGWKDLDYLLTDPLANDPRTG